MNRKTGSGSSMFLMEMIMVVLFFMLCASTCILAFAKSDRISRLASDRNHAVSAVESAVEIWKLEGTVGLEERLKARKEDDTLYVVMYDRDWELAEKTETAQETAYQLRAMLREPGDFGIQTVEIVAVRLRDGEELFEVQASRYRRMEHAGRE